MNCAGIYSVLMNVIIITTMSSSAFADAWRAPKIGRTFRECIAEALIDAAESGFARAFLDARCVARSEGSCTYSLTVKPELTNMMGNLHGGASCTIVDIFSSLAVRTIDARISVSVDMAHQFASPASVGDELSIVSSVDRSGRSLVFTRVQIFNVSRSGKLVVQGLHTKMYIDASKL